MKKNTHPKYYEANVECACGNAFSVGAAKPDLKVEICSNCHPFYTGKKKLVDTMGRVERYHKRIEKKDTMSKKSK